MSAVSSTPEYEEEKSLTILVTGYGSFINIKENPSSAIAFSLAGKTHVFSVTYDDGKRRRRRRYKLTFKPHREAVRVAYAAVDALVPRLWGKKKKKKKEEEEEEKKKKKKKEEEEEEEEKEEEEKEEEEEEKENGFDRGGWDYVLHLGVASLNADYSVETRAWEFGYIWKDVDGLIPGPPVGGTPEEAKERKGTPGEGSEPGSGRVLRTRVGVEEVVALVAGRVKDDDGQPVQIQSSSEAGKYLCEYIFRTSLLEAEKRGKTGRVLFLHVPPEGGSCSVETGVEVVKAVAEGMVVGGELAEGCGPDGC